MYARARMPPHFRAHEREASRLAATIRSASGSLVEASTRDLSLGGVGLEIGKSLSPVVALELLPGRQVDVEIAVPTYWDPVRLSGEVAWVREEGSSRARQGILLLGVRFRFATPGEVAPLTRFLGSPGSEEPPPRSDPGSGPGAPGRGT